MLSQEDLDENNLVELLNDIFEHSVPLVIPDGHVYESIILLFVSNQCPNAPEFIKIMDTHKPQFSKTIFITIDVDQFKHHTFLTLSTPIMTFLNQNKQRITHNCIHDSVGSIHEIVKMWCTNAETDYGIFGQK